jgi:hypothetical protein
MSTCPFESECGAHATGNFNVCRVFGQIKKQADYRVGSGPNDFSSLGEKIESLDRASSKFILLGYGCQTLIGGIIALNRYISELKGYLGA